MALVTLKDLLTSAKQNGYAVAAFNTVNFELIDAILDAAIEESAPVIVAVAEVHFKYLTLEKLAPQLLRAAAEVPVPVCVHLDHGESLRTIVRAIRAGFTSVMIDGSALPFEENVRLTRKVVEIAHQIGVSVEGELGRVGGSEGGTAGPAEAREEFFTRPEEARKFVELTGVDALAVSFGTVHGLYKGEPRLDFRRLSEIARAVDVPLVMHGGSGISDDDFREAIRRGITKINFYTGVAMAAVAKMREILSSDPNYINYPALLISGRNAAKEVMKHQIRVFGSSGLCRKNGLICASCSREGCSVYPSPARHQPQAGYPLVTPGPASFFEGVGKGSGAEDASFERTVNEITRRIIERLKGE